MCSAPGKKITQKGELTIFDYCINSPARGSELCKDHQTDINSPAPERLDEGVLTRKKRKEMGLDVDLITTNKGCRKPDNITVRKNRKETAGMLYAIRPCGVTVNSKEMIHAGWDI